MMKTCPILRFMKIARTIQHIDTQCMYKIGPILINRLSHLSIYLNKSISLPKSGNQHIKEYCKAPEYISLSENYKRFASSIFVMDASVEVERKFILTKSCMDQLFDFGAKDIGRKTFKDSYYDTPTYSLVLQDHWLRRREGKWQLKYPPNNRTQDKSSSYAELEAEDQIFKMIMPLLMSDKENKAETSLDNLVEAKCKVFAEFTTDRRSFQLDEFRVDIDSADFGYAVGEVELMVDHEDQVPEALAKIEELVQNLGVKSDKVIPGKMDTYLMRYNPDLYKQLIETTVLRSTPPSSKQD